MGKFNHPRKRIKMDRTTEDIATPVPPTIMEHYRDIHLDADVLFLNKIPFLLATLRDIGFIYCKALLSKHGKRVQNGLQSIILDTNFGDSRLYPLLGTGISSL